VRHPRVSGRISSAPASDPAICRIFCRFAPRVHCGISIGWYLQLTILKEAYEDAPKLKLVAISGGRLLNAV